MVCKVLLSFLFKQKAWGKTFSCIARSGGKFLVLVVRTESPLARCDLDGSVEPADETTPARYNSTEDLLPGAATVSLNPNPSKNDAGM